MTHTVPNANRSAERFRSAAAYYTTGRPGYPSLLIERVAELIGLERGHRVLDLGTGPGFLAIGFAAHSDHVTAIDPSPDMLEATRANAAANGVDITVALGSSYDLAAELAPLRLVTIGRAFHWMDRANTLRRLDELIEPGGAVALFSDKSPAVPANAWDEAYSKVREKHSAADRLGPETRATPLSNDAVLLDSAFDAIERHSVFERRATPLARFVDRVLSFGATWTGAEDGPAEEARVRAEVTADIQAALSPFATDGIIHEVVEGQAVIARRSR